MNRRHVLATGAGLMFTGFLVALHVCCKVRTRRIMLRISESIDMPCSFALDSRVSRMDPNNALPLRQGCSTPRLSAPPTLKGVLQFSFFRKETTTPIVALLFTCITNRMNGSMS